MRWVFFAPHKSSRMSQLPVSFTGRVPNANSFCARPSCKQQFSTCSPQHQAKWSWFMNTESSASVSTVFHESERFVCGPCAQYYRGKQTRVRGTFTVFQLSNFLISVCKITSPHCPIEISSQLKSTIMLLLRRNSEVCTQFEACKNVWLTMLQVVQRFRL